MFKFQIMLSRCRSREVKKLPRAQLCEKEIYGFGK